MKTVKIYNIKTEGSLQISANFKVREFKSRTHEFVLINYELLDKLQKLRDYLKAPININSGYRTTSHNNSVGGSYNSAHLIGCAADISSPAFSANQIAIELQNLFGKEVAIGLHTKENYVHVDVLYRGNWYKESLSNKVDTFA